MKRVIAFRPSAEYVQNLQVGSPCLDAFGAVSTVTEIRFRGVDVEGRPYVGYTNPFGANNGTMSNSVKAGQLVRTVHLSQHYTSAELDALEKTLPKHDSIPAPF